MPPKDAGDQEEQIIGEQPTEATSFGQNTDEISPWRVAGIAGCIFGVIALNAANTSMTKEIGSQHTTAHHRYPALGIEVPKDTFFFFPMCMVCFHFFFISMICFVIWKVTTGESFHLVFEAMKCTRRDMFILQLTNIFSSFGSREALLTVPLSLFACVRCLGSPMTQGMRVAVLGIPLTMTLLTQTILVTVSIIAGYYAQDEAKEVVQKQLQATASGGPIQDYHLYVSMSFLISGLFFSSMHSVYEELVMVKGCNPILMIAVQNISGSFFALPFIIGGMFFGLEDPRVFFVMMWESRPLKLMMLSLIFQKFVHHTCSTYLTLWTNSFWKVSLRIVKVWNQWLIELVAFYFFGNFAFGRPWIDPWSWLMLGSIALSSIALGIKPKKDKTNKKNKDKATT